LKLNSYRNKNECNWRCWGNLLEFVIYFFVKWKVATCYKLLKHAILWKENGVHGACALSTLNWGWELVCMRTQFFTNFNNIGLLWFIAIVGNHIVLLKTNNQNVNFILNINLHARITSIPFTLTHQFLVLMLSLGVDTQHFAILLTYLYQLNNSNGELNIRVTFISHVPILNIICTILFFCHVSMFLELYKIYANFNLPYLLAVYILRNWTWMENIYHTFLPWKSKH
jgi:hypothetical protein